MNVNNYSFIQISMRRHPKDEKIWIKVDTVF